MAFADVLAYNFAGFGFFWTVEVSFDGFSTTSHRWSTVSYEDGTNHFDGRIIEMDSITRSLGTDGFPVAASTELTLDNSDFALDWLVDHATWATYIPSARFRLKLNIYAVDTTWSVRPTVYSQQMGEYVCLDFPSRTAASVKVTLADDSLGRLADLALAPSINDWLADGDTAAANCPLFGSAPVSIGNWDAPLQLAFGNGLIRCDPANAGYASEPSGGLVYPIVICATTDTSASGDVPLTLLGQFKGSLDVGGSDWRGQRIAIPATFVDEDGTTKTIWSQQRTDPISKDGKTWRLIWLKFNAVNWTRYARTALVPIDEQSVGAVPQVVDMAFFRAGATSNEEQRAPFAWLAFECFWFQGYPLSARTVEDSLYQTGPDVIRDLIGYYSSASTADIDTDSFDEVKTALGAYFVGGTIDGGAGGSSYRGGVGGLDKAGAAHGQNKLRQVLGELLASIDANLHITWLGKYKLTAPNVTMDAITGTRLTVDESRVVDVEERTPSLGERWSPYNRLYVTGRDGETLGPFDHPTAAALSTGWKRIFPRTISAKWVLDNNIEGYWSYVWQRRLVEARHRSLIRFRTDPYALQLDLADYFEMPWTRMQGGSTPYPESTCWRVEGITIDPKTLWVDVEAVWQGDLDEEQPYLLDDESLIEVAAGSGGRTIAVTNADQTITFSSGSLITDAVEVGDILIVQDATSDKNNFANDIATRITAVTDATHLEVIASGWITRAALATWRIVKGALTYPDSGDDPINYPDDGFFYGKTGSDSDVFSDSSAANLLKDG